MLLSAQLWRFILNWEADFWKRCTRKHTILKHPAGMPPKYPSLPYAEHTILKHPVGMPYHSQGSSDPW